MNLTKKTSMLLVEIALDIASSSSVINERIDVIKAILDSYESGRLIQSIKLLDDLSCEFAETPEAYTLNQISKLLFKRPVSGDLKPEKSAFEKFLLSEDMCRETNRVLLQRLNGSNDDPVRVLRIAKDRIRRLLGPCTPSKVKSILLRSRPGGGLALGSNNRFRTSPVYKYTATDPTLYPRSRVYVDFMLHGTIGDTFFNGRRVDVHSSRLSFVPKNAKTHRSVAVEPNLTMMIQLGVHEFLADRLRQVNINISDQSWNQILSYLASKDSNPCTTLSTIDLSMASDLMSTALVEYLLGDWYSFLSDLRGESTIYKGEIIPLEKFATMGNGMTFALETLVFWAIAYGTHRVVDPWSNPDSTLSVYGDDIIVPTHMYGLLSESLQLAGFLVNHEKSFPFGQFKESCGTDWCAGVNVTPIKIEDKILTESGCYRLINRWNHIPSKRSVRQRLIKFIKENYNKRPILGFENEDDGSCIFTPFNYLKGSNLLTYDRNIQNWYCTVLKERGIIDSVCPVTWKYLHSLLSITGNGDSSDPTLRERTEVRRQRVTPGRKAWVWYQHLADN